MSLLKATNLILPKQEDSGYEGKWPRNQEHQLHRSAGPCPSVQELCSRTVGELARGESPADGTAGHGGRQSAEPLPALLEQDQTAANAQGIQFYSNLRHKSIQRNTSHKVLCVIFPQKKYVMEQWCLSVCLLSHQWNLDWRSTLRFEQEFNLCPRK